MTIANGITLTQSKPTERVQTANGIRTRYATVDQENYYAHTFKVVSYGELWDGTKRRLIAELEVVE